MINKAKEELENTVRHNDVIKEKESVHMTQNTIIISSESSYSDDSLEKLPVESYGSGRRQIPTKPVMSHNKSPTLTDKHKFDNEETLLKQPHQDAFTSKQGTLEIIKRLHIKCVLLYTEHLFMLSKTWLEYQQYEDVHVVITKKYI